MGLDADVIVVGAGLAGLVAAAELADAGKRAIIVDQEGPQSLGGQAFWSFGGIFLVGTPEQRRLRVRDTHALALQDWMSTACFDREEDLWPRRWAERYVGFAAGEKRSWLRAHGLRFFPIVGWAERGAGRAIGPGNSVPRFHIIWGTGPALVEAFARRVREGASRGLVRLALRHRVDSLTSSHGAIDGVRGTILEPSSAPRGQTSSRTGTGEFEFKAQAVILASGGIGGNIDLVRASWPERLGTPPVDMVAGVPAHVDGRMLEIAQRAGARLINCDRMWHYVEGVRNWRPVWPSHGIRILPGPSSMWFDASGRRLPAPLYPGFDTLGTLEYLRKTGHDHSWLVLNQSIIRKEFALSGSEQNPDLTGKSLSLVACRAFGRRATEPVEAFKRNGEDFVVRTSLAELVSGMNALCGKNLIDPARLEREIVARDREVDNPFGKDGQIAAIHTARRYLGDKLIRTAKPHKILDARHGPLIAVRLHILTRKTLGGLETDLEARVLRADGAPLAGLFAAGEVAGFGGGGMHGYRSLEGTFLGGCLFSGRTAGRAAERACA
ncbi:MAG: FAD-binding dehydrogenase [Hyphomicrobiales bacterium]|nr:FAD-binding dehydrogenase [Hyphomicrobiales bacterium]